MWERLSHLLLSVQMVTGILFGTLLFLLGYMLGRTVSDTGVVKPDEDPAETQSVGSEGEGEAEESERAAELEEVDRMAREKEEEESAKAQGRALLSLFGFLALSSHNHSLSFALCLAKTVFCSDCS